MVAHNVMIMVINITVNIKIMVVVKIFVVVVADIVDVVVDDVTIATTTAMLMTVVIVVVAMIMTAVAAATNAATTTITNIVTMPVASLLISGARIRIDGKCGNRIRSCTEFRHTSFISNDVDTTLTKDPQRHASHHGPVESITSVAVAVLAFSIKIDGSIIDARRKLNP